MDKKDVLFVGIGECGGKIVNEILKKDSRYVGMYINSNFDDFSDLETANDNMYIIPNATGTGKNRTKSKLLLKSKISPIIDEILKYKTAKILHFVFSLGGGTGGGSSPSIIKMLSALQKNNQFDKPINITCVLPAFDEGKRYKKNAIECWNEIARLENINSIHVLDNNKREDEEEINREFANQFDVFMNMHDSIPSKELKSRIDKDEIGNLAISKGSTLFYMLPSDKKDLKVGIAEATENSIFADLTEDVNECEYIGIINKEGQYNQKEIDKMFSPSEYSVGGYSDKYNFLVVTGTTPQKFAIEMLEDNIQEEEKDRKKSNVFSNLKVESNIDTSQPESVAKTTKKENTSKESKSIDDLLNDDDLWNDIL